MASNVIDIDGSVLEGGGQILRNAAALSAITGQSISVSKIRASRDNPGLRSSSDGIEKKSCVKTVPLNQQSKCSIRKEEINLWKKFDVEKHLSGLQIIRDLCKGELTDGKVGSSNITLKPGILNAGEFLADTKTAGSICLLIQAALPCILFARGPTRIVLKGGTNASLAPPFDYLIWVLKPTLERCGIKFNCDLIRRGFYPRGGGEVVLSAEPIKQIQPINLTERGEFIKVTGLAFCAGALPIKVANVLEQSARSCVMKEYRNLPINIDVVKETEQNAFGTGCAIILVAHTCTGCLIAGTGLGSKGVRAEDVGEKAGEELLSNMRHGGCVDEYLQDQLIIFMALSSGVSKISCGPLTLHTQTAIHIAQLLTKAKFVIEKISETSTVIQCEGIGHTNEAIS